MSPALLMLLYEEDMLCYCNYLSGLFKAIGIAPNPDEWGLFIDRSSRNLKAVHR